LGFLVHKYTHLATLDYVCTMLGLGKSCHPPKSISKSHCTIVGLAPDFTNRRRHEKKTI
jgi:hypothetical protein